MTAELAAEQAADTSEQVSAVGVTGGLESALPLAEVAARAGYQTQAHFTGVFHARVGTTPRAYRVRRNAR